MNLNTTPHEAPRSWRWMKGGILALAMVLGGLTSFAQVFYTVGTGTSTNTGTGYPTPFGDYYEGHRGQYLYLASELTAAGLSGGDAISVIRWNVTATNGAGVHEDFKIFIGHSTVGALTGFEAAPTQVYGPVSYTPTLGNNDFGITAFVWNGTDNVLVDVCAGDGTSFTNNASVAYTTTAFTSSYYENVDNDPNICTTQPSPSSSSNRANISFGVVDCAGPTAVSVGSIGTTGADVTFTPTSGSPVMFYVEYGAPGFSPGDGATAGGGTVVSGATSPISLTGLSAETAYEVYVREDCGGGPILANSGSVLFATACSGSTPLPYSESVDGAIVPILPPCISQIDDANGTTWESAAAPAGFVGNVMRIQTDATHVNDDWFFTQPISGVALAASVRLQWVEGNASATASDYEVTVGNTPSAAGAVIGTYSVTTGGGVATTQFIDYVNTLAGDLYFGFHAISPVGSPDLYIDDLFADLTPTCDQPDQPTFSNILGTSADVSFTCGGCTGSYEVEYGTAGFVQGSGTIVPGASSPIALTGLTAQTDYDAYVRQDCGAGGTSFWTSVESFTTGCVSYVAPYTENFDAALNNALVPDVCWTQNSSDNWTIAPSGDAGPNYGVVGSVDHTSGTGNFMWIDASGDIGANELITNTIDISGLTTPYVQFYLLANNITDAKLNEMRLDYWDGAAWANLISYTGNNASWVKLAATVPGSAPSEVMFRLQGVGDAVNTGSQFNNDLLIDDFSVLEAPTCFEPTAVAVSTITATSADVSFTCTSCSGTYYVEYGLPGFTPGTGATAGGGTVVSGAASPIAITGLTDNTTYAVYVREDCGGGDFSINSSSASFTTLCVPVAALPMCWNFDGYLDASIPDCYAVEDNNSIGGINTWATDLFITGTGYTTTPDASHMEIYTGDAVAIHNDWFWLQPVTMVGGTSYRVEFLYGITSTGAGTYTSELGISMGTSASVVGMTEYVGHLSMVSGSTVAQAAVFDFTPAASGDYYIGFADSSIASQFQYMQLDDICVDLTPACIDPTGLTATLNVTDMDVSWTCTGCTGVYDVEYGPTGFTPGTGTTVAGLAASPYSIDLTSLPSCIEYDVYVTQDCGGSGLSTTTGPVTFATLAGTVVAPYLQTWDGVGAIGTPAMPNCWTQTSVDVWDTQVSGGAGPAYGVQSSVDHTSGAGNFMWIDASGDIGANEVVSPMIDHSALTNPYASFWLLMNNITDAKRNMVSLDYWDGAAWVNMLVQASPQNANWVNIGACIPAAAPNPTQYRITAIGDGVNTGIQQHNDPLVDDFEVREAPCAAPGDLAASNISSSAADADWDGDCAPGTFSLEWGPTGFVPGTGTTVAPATAPFNISGLTAVTTYDVYVHMVCGAASSPDTTMISFTTSPSCAPVTALAATATSDATADVSWTCAGCLGTFVMEYDVAPYVADGSGTIINPATSTQGLTGLTAQTAYVVAIFQECGVGVYGDTVYVSFTTPCAADVAPYCQDFETGIGACESIGATTGGPWTTSTGFWNTVDCANPGANGGAAWLGVDMSGADVGILYEMNAVDVSALTNPEVEFAHFQCDLTIVPNELYVEAWDGAAWTGIALITGTGGAWTTFNYDLSLFTYGSGLTRIRFRAESGGDGNDFNGDIGIDDICIQEAPTCAAPIGLVVGGATGTTLDVSWTCAGCTGTYVVEYGTPGFTPGVDATAGGGTVVASATSPVTITGLSSFSAYEVYVRQDCGVVDGFSSNAGPGSALTLCGGTACDHTIRLTDTFGDGWNGATMDVVSGGAVVATVGPTFTTGNSIDVLVSLCEGASFDLVYTNSGGFPAEVGVVVLDPAATVLYTLASGTGTVGATPLFTWTAVCPACSAPSTVAISNETNTSGDIAWSAGTGSDFLEWGPAGFTPGIGLTAGGGTIVFGLTSPYTLSGLSPASSYDVYLRTDCGPLGVSANTPVATINTLCDVVVAPHTQNFDGAANNAQAPNCWTAQITTDAWTVAPSGDTGPNYGVAGSVDHSSGTGNFMWIDGSGNIGANELRTVEVNIAGLTTPWVEYYILSNNTTDNAQNEVDLDVSYDGGTNWTNLNNYAGNDPSWVLNGMVVPPGASDTVMFRFIAIGVTNAGQQFNNDLLIDDFSVVEAPTCFAVTALAISNESVSTLDVSWACVGCTGTYLLEYGPTGYTPGTGTTVNPVTSPYTITGLTGETVYDVYVTQDCGVVDGLSNASLTVGSTTIDCSLVPMVQCAVNDTFVFNGLAGNWNTNFCGFGTPGQEVIYQFNAPVAGTYTLQMDGGITGWTDWAWKDAAGGCTDAGWNCIDDIFGTTDTRTFTLPSAGLYLILADPESATATYQKVFRIECPATNIDCATADTVACGDFVSGNTANLTNASSLPATGCAFNGAASTGGVNWYIFEGTGDDVLASTCGLASFNTRISVYSAAPNDCVNLVCVGANDDVTGCGSNTSEVSFGTVIGTDYLIAVHGSGSANGIFNLDIVCSPACTPAAMGDACSAAMPLTPVLADGSGVATVYDNTCAYTDGPVSCSGATPVQGQFYTFNTGTATRYTLTLETNTENAAYSSTEIGYALFAGTACSGLSVTGTDMDCSSSAGGANVLPVLAPATDYTLVIYNQGGIGVEGTYGLLLEFAPELDAEVGTILAPIAWDFISSSICGSTFQPIILLKNNGQADLVSVDISWDIDFGTPQVYTWTGFLAYNQQTGVALPLTTTAFGVHTLNISVSNPNGGVDEVPANDANSVLYNAEGEAVKVHIVTDNFGAQTTWEIFDAFFLSAASGGPYPNNINVTEDHCLPSTFGTCYSFYVYDSFGDGMCCGNGIGEWELYDAFNNLILRDNGEFTSQSPDPAPQAPGYFAHEFCLPLGPSSIDASDCDVFTNDLKSKVYATFVPGVTNYRFEFSNPDAGFRRSIALGQRWVSFNGSLTTHPLYPLIPGTTYFCRVAVDQGATGFFDDHYGAGCEMAIDAVSVPGCTQLIDNPTGSTHSCGVTRSLDVGQKIWASPVLGATEYRFRFENVSEGYLRHVKIPGYALTLNTWATLPLQVGSTYDVSVELLISGVSGGFCGNVCQVTIIPVPAASVRIAENVVANASLYPNPVRDGLVQLTLTDLDSDEQNISVDVYDIFGKLVLAKEYGNSGSAFNTIIELDESIAAGTYVVHISVNDETIVERLNVQ